MLFRKDKIYLGAFCRTIASTCIKVPLQDIPSTDTESILSESEHESIQVSLLNFRLIVVLFSLLDSARQDKLSRSPNEISDIFMQGTALAFQDNSYVDSDVDSQMQSLVVEYNDYCQRLAEVPEEDLLEKTPFFYLCKVFSDKLFPMCDIHSELERKRNFLAFDVGKQVCMMVQEGFRQYFKRVKLLDG